MWPAASTCTSTNRINAHIYQLCQCAHWPATSTCTSGKGHLALAVFGCFSCPRASRDILRHPRMSQDALGQLKHLKTARARWPFPDARQPAASMQTSTSRPSCQPLMPCWHQHWPPCPLQVNAFTSHTACAVFTPPSSCIVGHRIFPSICSLVHSQNKCIYDVEDQSKPVIN